MNKTHFGFESIDWAQKTEKIRTLFTDVSAHYDVMNDAMSGGLHRCWKQSMVANLPVRCNDIVLDVAGGTGDIAFRLLIILEIGLSVAISKKAVEVRDVKTELAI